MKQLLLIIGLIGFTQLSYSQNTGLDSIFNAGKANLNSKNYIVAISQFTDVISKHPDNASAYYNRALAKRGLSIQSDYQTSEPCHDFATALELGMTDAVPHLERECMTECHQTSNIYSAPEEVFCADLNSKVLYHLPVEFNLLNNVVKINLFNNKLTNFPSEVYSLAVLMFLDLSSNKITEMHPEIKNLVYLKELNMNKNFLHNLPMEIGQLTHLKQLYLRANMIDELPHSMGSLKNLEEIDLAMNSLTSLPEEFANLKNLKTINLVGNPIEKKEQKKIIAMLPKTCKVYFGDGE